MGRDPTLDALLRWHRQLLKKLHPDKGGIAEDFRAALAAKVELDDALKAAASTSAAAPSPPGALPTQPTASSGQGAASASDGATAPLKRPAAPTTTARKRPASCGAHASGPAPPCDSSSRALVPLPHDLCAFCDEGRDGNLRSYRIQSNGVLLTYNGERISDEGMWSEFIAWVEANKKAWKVKYHCKTMEMCRRRRPHLHLMLQFHETIDRASRSFAFKGILPNARPAWQDYCGQGRNKRNPQQSLDRGFFYVWCNTIGTCVALDGRLCVDGNYGPVWTDSPFLYEA